MVIALACIDFIDVERTFRECLGNEALRNASGRYSEDTRKAPRICSENAFEMNKNTMANSILLLDDDAECCRHLSDLLHSRGLNVVEAATTREANALLRSCQLAMAIVDYQLPEQDGISWITEARNDGYTFPIVFLSVVWCDEKAFSRLRNLLKVSLILQEPIIADLFLQHLENVLPANLLVVPRKTLVMDDHSNLSLVNCLDELLTNEFGVDSTGREEPDSFSILPTKAQDCLL